MNRQSHRLVPDTNALSNSNSYANTQMQQQMPAQRMQQNHGLNNFLGQPDSFPAERGGSYVSPAHWYRDALAKAGHPNSIMLSHPYSDAKGNAVRFLYQGHIPGSRVDREYRANKEAGYQPYEQDVETGYEETPSPLSLEGLEKKFQGEILKLSKEQDDAEDGEILRHKKVAQVAFSS